MAAPRNHWAPEYAPRNVQQYHEPRYASHHAEAPRLPPPSSLMPPHAVQSSPHAVQSSNPGPGNGWSTHPPAPAAVPAPSAYSHHEFEPRVSQRPQPHFPVYEQPSVALPAIATADRPSEVDKPPPPSPQYCPPLQVGVRVIGERPRYVPAPHHSVRGQKRAKSPSPSSPTTEALPAGQKRAMAMAIPNLASKDKAEAVKDLTFRLDLRQQPRAARSCGFGDKDRRVIDPPPILELVITSPHHTEEEIRRYRCFESYVVTVAIYDETGTQDETFMPDEYRNQRRLMGSLISTPFVGKDEFKREGCFFTFSDLSCRTPGAFRLGFSVMMVKTTGKYQRFPIVAETMSDVFHVFNAKDFPGMVASSDLAQTLKAQGCILQLKKGNTDRPMRDRGGHDESDDDMDDDDDERMQNSRRKRRSIRG